MSLPIAVFDTARVCARAALALAAFLLLAVAGCAPKNPYEAKIDAASPKAFNNWLLFNNRHLKGEEIAEMRSCIQEIKFHLRATGQADTEERLRAELDGKPLKQVIVEGHRLRIERLKKERLMHVEDLQHKERLRTRPGDTASADYLEHQKNLRRGQIADFADRINKAVARHNVLLGQFRMSLPAEEPVPAVPSEPPAPAPPDARDKTAPPPGAILSGAFDLPELDRKLPP